jgi:outer membrane protein assembly factor BamB
MKTISRNFILLLSFLATISINCGAQDWPQWRGPNRNDQVVGFKAPQTWPSQLAQTWKVTIGTGDATPALVNNKIYAFGKMGGNEVLQCIDAATGKQIWQAAGYPSAEITGPAASHPGPRGSVAVADNKVVTFGAWGDLACYDASNGKLIWRNEAYKGQVPQFATGMSPLIYDGVVFAHLGGPDKGTFIALNLANGTEKWKVDGESPTYSSPVLLDIDGTKQIVFQAQTKLVSFATADGKLMWEYNTPIGTGRVQICSSPVIDNNKIYFTGLNNGVNAIEVKKQGSAFTVSELWKNPGFSTGYNTLLLKEGFLYGFSGQGGKMFCVNASNGQTAWEGDIAFQSFGTLVDAGSVIVGLSGNSKLVVFKPNGQKFDMVSLIDLTEKGIYAQPILTGNKIYIKDTDSLVLFTL